MNLSTLQPTSIFATSSACRPRGIIELGTQSLKVHELYGGNLRTRKHAYTLGHEVYSSGVISESTLDQVIDIARSECIHANLAICTGAARDAGNRAELLEALSDPLDLGAFVLSPHEEALLLALGYLGSAGRAPALLADIGGGTVEVVYLGEDQAMLWDCLPLGAVRLHDSSGGIVKEHIAQTERELRKLSLDSAEDLHVSGGTVRTIIKVLQCVAPTRQKIAALERKVRMHGPPDGLKPDRAVVFHSGLLLTLKLLEKVGAKRVHWLPICPGRTLLAWALRYVDACWLDPAIRSL